MKMKVVVMIFVVLGIAIGGIIVVTAFDRIRVIESKLSGLISKICIYPF